MADGACWRAGARMWLTGDAWMLRRSLQASKDLGNESNGPSTATEPNLQVCSMLVGMR